jgi:hypothetical protein
MAPHANSSTTTPVLCASVCRLLAPNQGSVAVGASEPEPCTAPQDVNLEEYDDDSKLLPEEDSKLEETGAGVEAEAADKEAVLPK